MNRYVPMLVTEMTDEQLYYSMSIYESLITNIEAVHEKFYTIKMHHIAPLYSFKWHRMEAPHDRPSVIGIHRLPVNYHHKGPMTNEASPCHDVIMCVFILTSSSGNLLHNVIRDDSRTIRWKDVGSPLVGFWQQGEGLLGDHWHGSVDQWKIHVTQFKDIVTPHLRLAGSTTANQLT